MKIEPITCIQSVYYLSYADKEQAMSEQVNIDIHQSKYDQYLVGFTQLFNIQEKHGRKHTLRFLIMDLCWPTYTESPNYRFQTSAKKSPVQYSV